MSGQSPFIRPIGCGAMIDGYNVSTLSVGTRIGPYQVVGPLGPGGMDEVYRARDTKLNLDVAVTSAADGQRFVIWAAAIDGRP